MSVRVQVLEPRALTPCLRRLKPALDGSVGRLKTFHPIENSDTLAFGWAGLQVTGWGVRQKRGG